MMQFFIIGGFPLRGALTYGEIYANMDSKVFLGKAISDAVVLEGRQEWIGAVIDSSAMDRYPDVFEKESADSVVLRYLLPLYDVPFKDGSRKRYHVINWRQNIVAQDGVRALFNSKTTDEGARRKIDNALQFAKAVVDSGKAYFDDYTVPGRYRKLYVARTLPSPGGAPFRNGDEF